ncbi:hypothetical protein Bca4012_037344 [Brassica carinata]
MLMSLVKVMFPSTNWMQLRNTSFVIELQTALNFQMVMYRIYVTGSTKMKKSLLA